MTQFSTLGPSNLLRIVLLVCAILSLSRVSLWSNYSDTRLRRKYRSFQCRRFAGKQPTMAMARRWIGSTLRRKKKRCRDIFTYRKKVEASINFSPTRRIETIIYFNKIGNFSVSPAPISIFFSISLRPYFSFLYMLRYLAGKLQAKYLTFEKCGNTNRIPVTSDTRYGDVWPRYNYLTERAHIKWRLKACFWWLSLVVR